VTNVRGVTILAGRRRGLRLFTAFLVSTSALLLSPTAASAAPPANAPVTKPAVTRGNAWYLRNSATTGIGDIAFVYGDPGDITLMGDWNGDGTDTPGVVRNGMWYLRNTNTTGVGEVSFAYGDPGDFPIVGDWDGNGTDTPGVFRKNTSEWHLRNSNTTGIGEISFMFGPPPPPPSSRAVIDTLDTALAGDWDGNGTDTPGGVGGPLELERDGFGTKRWRLHNSNSSTDYAAFPSFSYRAQGDSFFTGDWNGDGRFSPGAFDAERAIWSLRNAWASPRRPDG